MDYPTAIPKSAGLRLRPAIVRNRPLRLGFIVNRTCDATTLQKIFQYNCMMWGGRYNLYVPTDGQTIRHDWWRLLYSHDPDIVIFAGDIQQELARKIYDELLPYEIFTWTDRVLEEVTKAMDLHGISVWSLFAHQNATEGETSPENTNCSYPAIGAGRYSLFYEIAFGTYPPRYADINSRDAAAAYRSLLGASDATCQSESFAEFMEALDLFDERMTPLRFGSRFATISYENFLQSMSHPMLIVTDGSVDDLFLYHLARWKNKRLPCIPVFADDLKSPGSIALIGQWLGSKIPGNLLNIASLSVDLGQLQAIREDIRPHLPPEREGGWYILLQRAVSALSIPVVLDNFREVWIPFEDQTLYLSTPELSFRENLQGITNWVMEINLSPRLGFREGFIPSMFPRLNLLLSGWEEGSVFGDARSRRIARGLLALRVSDRTGIQRTNLPSPEKLIRGVLKDAGYDLAYSNLGRYCQGMVELAGNLEEMRFLRNEHMLKLFYSLSDEKYELEKAPSEGKDSSRQNGPAKKHRRRVRAYTLHDMVGKIGNVALSGAHRDDIRKHIDFLTGKEIFQRGYNLRCPRCDLETWYAVEEMQEWMVCKGCRFEFRMNLVYERFAFQLNQLYFEGLSQGAASVLLTAMLLERGSMYSTMWLAGCELRQSTGENDEKAELDLIAMCDGLLIVAECKNAYVESRAMAQIQRDIQTAKSLKAEIFLFATLQDSVSTQMTELLDNINASEPDISVRLVSRQELLEGQLIRTDEPGKKEQATLWSLVKQPQIVEEDLWEADPRGTGGRLAI